jgi:hypothetical protein
MPDEHKPKRKPHLTQELRQYQAYILVALTAGIIAAALAIYLTPAPQVNLPTMTLPPFTITPTLPYTQQINNGHYDFILREASGSIAADSRVQLVGSWYDQETSQVWYSVQAESDFATANAQFQQLEYNPVVPTVPILPFQSEIGMGGFRMMTTEQVGEIPAGTRVRISHATQNPSGEWVYAIVPEDQATTAGAFAHQLTYAPGVIPGATPTARFNDAMFIGQYNLITREQIGSIPAGTRVITGSAYLGADEWVYNISADGGNYVEARESQLDFAPDFIPGTPAPTLTVTPV